MTRSPLLLAASISTILVALIALFLIDERVFQRDHVISWPNVTLEEHMLTTAKAYESYRQWTISENQRIFDWHLRSTKIIFWTSIIVAIVGLGFAFWQFVEASYDARKAVEVEEMELKSQLISLSFKSRSIAALVMFISIAYLLIYVVLVYPIRNVPQSPLPATVDVGISAAPGQDEPAVEAEENRSGK